jgi:hypothetical protein
MPFTEVFASGVPEERTRLICAQSVAALMEGEGAPDNPAARVISWLVWQKASARSIGGQPVRPAEAPCYLGRISVPAGSLTEQRMPRSSAAPPLYSPPSDDQPERFTKARRLGAGHRHRRGRAGGAWPAGAVPRDHRLRHDRRPRPS